MPIVYGLDYSPARSEFSGYYVESEEDREKRVRRLQQYAKACQGKLSVARGRGQEWVVALLQSMQKECVKDTFIPLLLEIGFTPEEMVAGGIELRCILEHSTSEIKKRYGFTPKQFLEQGITVATLLKHFGYQELKAAGIEVDPKQLSPEQLLSSLDHETRN